MELGRLLPFHAMTDAQDKTHELFTRVARADGDLGYPDDVSFLLGDQGWVVARLATLASRVARQSPAPHHDKRGLVYPPRTRRV